MYNRFSLENYHDGIFNLTTKKASMVPTFDPVKLCVTLFRDRRDSADIRDMEDLL